MKKTSAAMLSALFATTIAHSSWALGGVDVIGEGIKEVRPLDLPMSIPQNQSININNLPENFLNNEGNLGVVIGDEARELPLVHQEATVNAASTEGTKIDLANSSQSKKTTFLQKSKRALAFLGLGGLGFTGKVPDKNASVESQAFEQSKKFDGGAGGAVTIGAQTKQGVWRWAIKTLSDSEASEVNTVPQPTSIEALTSIPSPIPSAQGNGYTPPPTKRFPAEKQVWQLNNVLLLEARHEGDGDYHLVLADPANPSATMIAEIPDPSMPAAASSAFASQFQAVRSAFESNFGVPPSYSENPNGLKFNPAPSITITGPAFFDEIHGQDGVAPNGIELHPLLSLQVNASANQKPLASASDPNAISAR